MLILCPIAVRLSQSSPAGDPDSCHDRWEKQAHLIHVEAREQGQRKALWGLELV